LFDLHSGLRTAYLVRVPAIAVSARSADASGDLSEAADSTADLIVVGAALGGRGEIDLVISPEYRRRGYGRAAARELGATEPNGLTAWSHGDHPAARALASELRYVAARTLLELRKPLGAATAEADTATAPSRENEAAASASLDGGIVSAFRPGVDDEEWVALNALVFATHPEQGAITEADLAARQGESWFKADDFLILRDADGRMIGYNWLKIDEAIGEIYVIGVHPDAAGRGFGRVLMQAGLQRLVDAGCTTAALYVEADSLGPVHLYRTLGFVDHTVDVQYRRLPE
jgi:mycothiol synthase